jgi:hypothetical protein
MDVCLPSDFLALRASVDNEWRDGCAGFSSAHSRAGDSEYWSPSLPPRMASRCEKYTPPNLRTSTHADPAWQVI